MPSIKSKQSEKAVSRGSPCPPENNATPPLKDGINETLLLRHALQLHAELGATLYKLYNNLVPETGDKFDTSRPSA